jgi:hypothetical protein
MAQNLDLNININTKGSEVIGVIRKELSEANGELLKAQTLYGNYSKEAITAAQKVAELKDKITEARKTSDLFDPGKKFQAFSGVLSTVAGGLSAVQGAMGLLGAESDDVQKTLLKVQSAMALSQGLSSIKDSATEFTKLGKIIQSTTVFQKANEIANKATAASMKLLGISAEVTSVSFKVLKTAIVSTGIGVLVIALGEAVAAFQNYKNSADKAAEAQQNLNNKIAESAKGALKAELDFLSNQEKIDVAKAKAKGASEKEIFDIEQGYRRQKGEAQVRYWNAVKDADKKGAEEAQEEVNKINADGVAAKENFDAKVLADKKQKGKDRSDKEKQAAKEREAAELDAAKKIIELKNDVEVLGIKDEFEAKKKAIQNGVAAEIEDVKKNEKLKAETKTALITALNDKADAEIKVALNQKLDEEAKITKEKNKKLLEDQRELRVSELQDKIQLIDRENELLENDFEADQIRTENKREYLKEQKEIELSDLDLDQNQRFEIITKYANLERNLDKEIADSKKQQREEELRADEELQEAKYQIAQSGLGLLSSLAGENEKLANVIFAISKALEIGRIISTTAGAITQVNANTLAIPAILPPALVNPAFVTAAVIGAKKIATLKLGAAASIATIAAASISKFKSGGGGGGGIQGGSAATAQAPIIPQLPAAQTTNISRQSINDLGNQAVRAYVIETDVTGNQQRMAAIRQRARFS